MDEVRSRFKGEWKKNLKSKKRKTAFKEERKRGMEGDGIEREGGGGEQ